MDTNRREFLKSAIWMGAAAATVGCTSGKAKTCGAAGACGFPLFYCFVSLCSWQVMTRTMPPKP